MTDHLQTTIAAVGLTVEELKDLEVPQAPMTIADNADIYSVLPTLYEFVQAHIGHYAPSEEYADAFGRVECETLQKLIDALDILIAIAPADTGK